MAEFLDGNGKYVYFCMGKRNVTIEINWIGEFLNRGGKCKKNGKCKNGGICVRGILACKMKRRKKMDEGIC